MKDDEKPETLSDDTLDTAQGGGLMDTPVGGWGVKNAATGTRPETKPSTNDPADRSFGSTASGSPNV